MDLSKVTSDYQQYNDLLQLFYKQDVEGIRNFFEKDENVHLADGEINAMPFIIYVAQKKNWDIFKTLFEAGADVNKPYTLGKRYLIHECIDDAPDKYFKAVLELADLNVFNRKGEDPLMYAYNKGKMEKVEAILEVGRVDKTNTNQDKNTFAHLVAMNQDYPLFKKLVEMGYPMNFVNKDGKNPIDYIEDISFKDTLSNVSTQRATNSLLEKSEKELISEKKEEAPKVSGLSKITKKKP